jgi:hypothetical protein
MSLLWGLGLVFLAPAAGGEKNADPFPARLSGDGRVARGVLKRDDLLRGADVSSPIDNPAGFAVPANAAEPTESFEGTLTLGGNSPSGHFTLLSDVFQLVPREDSAWKHLPPFRFQFVQSRSFLIPAEQGLFHTGDPAWNYIVGPGRVWKEVDDAGYMRASLPFALVQRNQNCVHNGAMTFLFSTTKTPRMSRVFYQITQETCYPMKFDMWGMVEADFSPGSVPGGEALRARHAADQTRRMPSKPLSALAGDSPSAGIDLAAIERGYERPKEITTYGLVFRGVHYSSGCPTRSGDYPFCEEMRLPSYSIAKSVFAGVALMRLGQLYGPSVYGLRLTDYLPAKAPRGRWDETTFGHASDMATGNFDSDRYEEDENGAVMVRFLVDESLEDKIRDSFDFYKDYAAPGTVWVYQSSATFLLTQAMSAYLRQQRGGGGDIFALVEKDVYEPLHMSRGFMTTIRTENSPNGAPAGYYGLFLNKDDAAKISTFLNTASGRIDGEQVLEPKRLAEALFRSPTPETAGVPILGRNPHSALGEPSVGESSQATKAGRRYAHGFWGRRITPAEFPDLGCDLWISLMSGYGGNIVLLLPNGVSYYIFSDGMEFRWRHPLSAAAKLAPMCD